MQERKFQIICDSCCDLPRACVEQLGIEIVPLYVSFDGENYERDYFDFTYHEFYQRMADEPGRYPKTSLPGVEDYIRTWEPYLKEGIPVLSISMTSMMSGSYNSAANAASIISEKYPDVPVVTLDSKALTLYEGMLVREACRMRDLGMDAEETAKELDRIRHEGRAYFTIGDLSYLSRGGRIGGLVKLAAVGLGIKPVILFSEGSISLCSITRSRHKSLRELARQAAQYFVNKKEDPSDYYLEVGYGLHEEDGEELKDLFASALKEAGIEADPGLSQIGTMVGAHNGPYLMGIALQKRSR